jgi:hypothetical protein
MIPANPAQSQFTEAEIDKMRTVIFEHDKLSSPKTLDLNNPPRQNYRFQEWPTVVCSLDAAGKPIMKKVHNPDQLAAALAAGWSKEQQAEAEPEEILLDPASQAEVDAVEKHLAELRKKKTPPVKAVTKHK